MKSILISEKIKSSYIRQHPLFRKLDEEQFRDISAKAKLIKLKRNNPFLLNSEPHGRVFFLGNGTAKLVHFNGSVHSIVKDILVDGEVFLLKTRGLTPPYRPRLQLIEGHRVGTPGALIGGGYAQRSDIIDGVEIDGKGRPVAYYVMDGVNAGDYSRIPADNIIHLFEPNRVGMYRGISHFYAVMNALHDLDDLERLEMQAAKDAASTTKVIKTPSGEDVNEETEWSGVQTSETGAANPLFEYYKKVFGAKESYRLKMGPKIGHAEIVTQIADDIY